MPFYVTNNTSQIFGKRVSMIVACPHSFHSVVSASNTHTITMPSGNNVVRVFKYNTSQIFGKRVSMIVAYPHSFHSVVSASNTHTITVPSGKNVVRVFI